MKYLIDNSNYPMNKIVENFSLFDFLEPTNTKLINNCVLKKISDDVTKIFFNFNDINNLGLDKFKINLKMKRQIYKNNILYFLENTNNDFENIQFSSFKILINKINNNKYTIDINYDFNNELYNKMLKNIFNKIIIKIFKNLEERLNKIYK